MLPAGIFNTRYSQDMAIIRTRMQWVILILALVGVFLVPLFISSAHIMSIANYLCITIISVLGLYFVMGLAGQIHLGTSAFMALGAYTTAILMVRFGISFWLTLPFSAVIGVIAGLLVGIPALKVKGLYLAITTMAAHFIIIWMLGHPPLSAITGGVNGINTPIPSIFGIGLDTDMKWFYVVMPFTLLAIFFAKNIGRTRVGRAWVAIRDNDLAAEVMGINVFNYKVLSFVVCSVFNAIAGSLFAPYMINLNPGLFTMMESVWYMGMVIVGGTGSVVGVIAGAILLRLLGELATSAGSYISSMLAGSGLVSIIGALGPMIYGLVIILFLIFEPKGISYRWEIFKRWYRLHPFPY